MATAKKTSSKKKTTTKKSASASASKKKTASKKVAAPKKSTAKATPMVTLEKLYKFNMFAAVAYLGFAVLSVIFLSNTSVNLLFAHSTKDELAATEDTLGPAFTNVLNIEVRYLLAVVFGISAIFSILLATKLRSRYEKGVSDKVSSLRWIFLGISSALTLEVVSILGGVTEVAALKLIAGLILVTSILGLLSEAQNKNNQKQFSLFYLSLFTGFLAWIPLISGLIGTGLFGIQNFSWYVYVLAAVVLTGFINIALIQYRYVKTGANTSQYLDVEGKYVSTDFLIKLAVFVITFIAFYK